MLLLLVLLLLPWLVCSRWLSNLVGIDEGGALTGISFWLDERASRDAVDRGSQRLSLVILFHQYQREWLALQAASHPWRRERRCQRLPSAPASPTFNLAAMRLRKVVRHLYAALWRRATSHTQCC